MRTCVFKLNLPTIGTMLLQQQQGLTSKTLIFQGTFEQRRWKEIVVGDIVRVKDEKPFPADLILLSSSQSEGMCHIETANLVSIFFNLI